MNEISESQKQERMWGMLCHLSSLLGFIGIPFGNIIGPLVIWLIKKGESPFIDQAGKEALNFQISLTVYSLIALLLCLVFIGFPILLVLLIANVVLTIIAGIKTNDGLEYKHKYIFRLIQ